MCKRYMTGGSHGYFATSRALFPMSTQEEASRRNDRIHSADEYSYWIFYLNAVCI
jgi:hypothetical protein